MAESIFGAFGNYGSFVMILKWIGWFLLFAVIAGVITAMVLFAVVKRKEKKIVEINMVTKKIVQMSGKEKKNKSTRKQFFISKLRKFLPRLQQEDIYLQKGKDVVFLIKDNNGLHHTARLPRIDEVVKWYKVVHDIDISEEVKKIKEQETEEEKQSMIETLKDTVKGIRKKEALNIIGTIYLMPNPAEDLEWLADEQDQANKAFGTGLLKHPAMVWIGTLSILAFLTIVWLIVMKKM